jgi:hypothetical protein
LRQDEVEELTGLFALDLADLPHQVTRWFSIGKTRSSADMPTADMATYSFAHPLLAEEFRRHLGREARQMEERLLKWCENWREHPSLPYILRHYADHLYDKWQMTNEQMTYDALCRLALDPDFKQAQTKHLPDEPNLPLKTVQLALKVAIQLEDALMMARLLIEHAKRAQSEAETPLQAWRKGHRGKAFDMATDFVFKQDYKLGTLWSLLLARVAESEGERDWAKRFLDEVRKRWEGAKLTELGDWQGEMAVFLLGEVWQVEGAVEVAGLVLDDEFKRELATSWASKGLFDQALKVAEGIEEAGKRAGALREIAGGMAKAGMTDWAKEVFEQALKVAEGIEKADKRAEALREIAKEMAKAGMFDQALKVAEGIEDTEGEAKALSAVAVEMAKIGMIEWTKEVFEQALKVVKWWQAEVLSVIAVEMAETKMFEQALEVAGKIIDAMEQSWALSAIAVEIAKAGMMEWAEEVFEQALEVVERIEYVWWRTEALEWIAGETVKAGMFDQALKAVERIEDAWDRYWALKWIVREMAKAGMFDQALKVAEGIWWADKRAEALREIAEGMAKAGMFEQALKVAEGIEGAWWRAEALIAIAEGMAKAGMMERAKEVFEQSLKVAEGIEDAGKRARVLREIAEGMARAGEVEGAVGIVEREMVVRTEELPSVLSALAERARKGDEKSKKDGFLKLLPLCGWSLKFAYQACGLLAWLYPEMGEEIAGVIAATGD